MSVSSVPERHAHSRAGQTGTGSQTTRLVVLRGNSGSGKTSAAVGVCTRHGQGIALVGQDILRRIVMGEDDVPDGANIGLIDTVARYALDCGFDVVIEGILYASHYARMLDALRRDHHGRSFFYYLEVPLEETLRRQAGRAEALEFDETMMRDWYRERDLLPGSIEHVIPASSSLEDIIAQVMADAFPARQLQHPRAGTCLVQTAEADSEIADFACCRR